MILVDANIWIYFLDAATPESKRVQAALPKLLDDHELVMPTLVQLEVVHYLVREMGARAADAIDGFLSVAAHVEPVGADMTAEAARFLLAHRGTGIGSRDAFLLVMAKHLGAGVATHDRKMASLAPSIGIEVEDPAKAS